MDFGIAGKTVLVNAASRGLGFATAKAFAGEGAKVALSGRDAERLNAAVRTIQSETGNQQVMGFVADLVDGAAIEKLFDSVEAHFGGVDVLINNAGGPPAGTFTQFSDADWTRAYELCLLSFVRCIRRSLPHMREQRWGRIVNFASSSIRQPIDNLILSNTFRAGVAGLAKSLAIELAPYNILVNTLGPGRIATDRVASLDALTAEREGIAIEDVQRRWQKQIPLGRYGEPDEFAAVALFLGSAANGYVTGQSVLVDGGLVRSL
jgi:3-oxoacyl-[acyl-carrier protein] reductase